MKSHLDKLKQLTIEKKVNEIFNYLNQSATNFYKSNVEKGTVLEEYLKYLYESYGYHVLRHGGAGDRGVDLKIALKNIIDPDMYMQVKNHNKVVNHDMIINDMSKFNSEYGKNKEIDKKFVYFSLNGFTKEVLEDTKQSYKTMSFKDIEVLITSFDNIKYTQQKIKSNTNLLPHNVNSYNKTKEMALTKNEIAVIQPTGTGKMYIINELCIDFFNKYKNMQKKAMVVAPSNFILDKIKNLNNDFIKSNIIYKTYSALLEMSLKEMQELNVEEIYFDEMHRLGAKEWGGKAEQLIQISNAKIYGFTATNDRIDGIDIANTIFKGNIANEFSLTEAIYQGLLKAPIYVTSLYSIKDEKDKAIIKIQEKINLDNEKKEEFITNLNANCIDWEDNHNISTIFKKYLENHNHYKNDKKTKLIVFCKDIKHAKNMEIEIKRRIHKTELFNNINTYIITSENSKKENEEYLQKFENNKKKDECDLLFSVDQLNEGVHVDNITGVVFFRESYSKIIYFQQLGRALSVNNKEIPIVFDFVNNFNSLAKDDLNKDFEKIKQSEVARLKRIGITNKQSEFKIELIDETKDFKNLLKELKNTNQKSKYEIMKEFRFFVEKYDDYPRVKAKYEGKLETNLNFIISYRRKRGFVGFTKEEINEINELENKYINKNSNININMIKLISFIKKEKRPPSKGMKKTNEEISLSIFLNKFKTYLNYDISSLDENIKKEYKKIEHIIKTNRKEEKEKNREIIYKKYKNKLIKRQKLTRQELQILNDDFKYKSYEKHEKYLELYKMNNEINNKTINEFSFETNIDEINNETTNELSIKEDEAKLNNILIYINKYKEYPSKYLRKTVSKKEKESQLNYGKTNLLFFNNNIYIKNLNKLKNKCREERNEIINFLKKYNIPYNTINKIIYKYIINNNRTIIKDIIIKDLKNSHTFKEITSITNFIFNNLYIKKKRNQIRIYKKNKNLITKEQINKEGLISKEIYNLLINNFFYIYDISKLIIKKLSLNKKISNKAIIKKLNNIEYFKEINNFNIYTSVKNKKNDKIKLLLKNHSKEISELIKEKLLISKLIDGIKNEFKIKIDRERLIKVIKILDYINNTNYLQRYIRNNNEDNDILIKKEIDNLIESTLNCQHEKKSYYYQMIHNNIIKKYNKKISVSHIYRYVKKNNYTFGLNEKNTVVDLQYIKNNILKIRQDFKINNNTYRKTYEQHKQNLKSTSDLNVFKYKIIQLWEENNFDDIYDLRTV